MRRRGGIALATVVVAMGVGGGAGCSGDEDRSPTPTSSASGGTGGAGGVGGSGGAGAATGGVGGDGGSVGGGGAAGAPALGRGINLGNALEAPDEGDWGVTLEQEYFGIIQSAGFETIRVPTRWSAHAAVSSPYTIDETFFERIDWVLDEAEAVGLNVVLNVHHYEEMVSDPEGHRDRLVGIWRQIAQRYQQRPPTLFFELLNEPNAALTRELWNDIAADLIVAIRESNPSRTLVVGRVQWNSISELDDLVLPDDPNLMGTFHYYSPFQFTHQGASWVSGSDAWLGTTWDATAQEQTDVRDDLDQAAAWSSATGYPLLLGEFGAYEAADMDSRVRWTDFVAREAEQRGIAWTYWEFCAGIGAYDRTQSAWRTELLEALIPP